MFAFTIYLKITHSISGYVFYRAHARFRISASMPVFMQPLWRLENLVDTRGDGTSTVIVHSFALAEGRRVAFTTRQMGHSPHISVHPLLINQPLFTIPLPVIIIIVIDLTTIRNQRKRKKKTSRLISPPNSSCMVAIKNIYPPPT